MFQKAQHRWYVFTASFTERERVLFLATSFVLGVSMLLVLSPPPLHGETGMLVGAPLDDGQRIAVGFDVPRHAADLDVVYRDLSPLAGAEPGTGVVVRTHVARSLRETGAGVGSIYVPELGRRYDLRDLAGHRQPPGPVDWQVAAELGFDQDGPRWAVLGPFDLRYRVGWRNHTFRSCTFVTIWQGPEPDQSQVAAIIEERTASSC